MHTCFGNKGNPEILQKKLVILQLNCSNSNFMTKKEELDVTIESNKADIVVVSESNMDTTDQKLLDERQSKFPTFRFVDKVIQPFPKARLTIMVHHDVPFERAEEYEDQVNPMASIRIRESRNKAIIITGIYRQWKAPAETDSNTAEGIARQVQRLELAIQSLSRVVSDGNIHLVAGDINIDRHLPNDPLSRPDLRALTPVLEDYLIDSSMVQINHKPTRHQLGSRSSLLDLFLTNVPDRIVDIDNVLNTLSEHQGVICTILTKTPCKLSKSILIRNYANATFRNMQGLIDQSENLQSLFNDRDPDIIGDKLIAGFDEITNLVITKKRIQVCNRGAKFWSKSLENERKTVAGLNTQAIRTRNPEDFRFYKNKKNTHTRNIIKYQKQKIRENFAKAKTRWKTFDQIIPQDDSTPKQIKYKGKVISSAREIANSYHEYLDAKLEDLHRQIKQTNFKAMKIFWGRINRVEDDMVLAPATIKEARMIIRKMKPSNSRGDSEITGRIIKQVSQYTSVAITHLANCVFTTGRFPAAFKTARILPLKKHDKPEDYFSGFRPINCLNPLSKILEEMIRVRIETMKQWIF